MTVRTWLRPLRLEASRGDRVILPVRDWWSLVVWKLQTNSGRAVTFTSESVKMIDAIERGGVSNDRPAIRDDQILIAECELPPLEPADYSITVELRIPPIETQPPVVAVSERAGFLVRRGDEDPDVRRTFLRAEAERLGTTRGPDRFVRLHDVLVELTALEPNNPTPYERLGDESVGVTTIDETAEYYETARRVSEQNLRTKYGQPDTWPEEISAFWQIRSRALTAFARAVRRYTPGDGIHFQITNLGSKKLVKVLRGRDVLATLE